MSNLHWLFTFVYYKYVLGFFILIYEQIDKLRNRLRHQNYDPINFETLDDHSDWVLEESPPYLTIEEVEALRKDLASMTIQPNSDDIGMFLYYIMILMLH